MSGLPDDELMSLFTRLTRWADYLNVVLTSAEIDEEASEAYLRLAEASALVLADPKKGEVTKVKAERMLDDDVKDAHEHHRKVRAYRKLLRAVYENVDRDAAHLSRELTRRVGREPRDRRADRWG